MICPECNKNVPNGFTVCPHCGLSLQTINKINQKQAMKEAQAKVRGEELPQYNGGAVSSKIKKRPPKKKKAFGVPGAADYLRLVTAVVTFVFMCFNWYKLTVGKVDPEVFTMTIFGSGRGGIFVLPIFFGVLSIVLLVMMIANTFLNFRKLVPALKKIDTLRLISMLYSVSYILTLFFALCAVIFTHVSGFSYSLTVWYVISVITAVIFAYITFGDPLDRMFGNE
ncbi:MAG: hypothetical protein IJT91_03665 [Clostridia bacterium]|nr:hypothetical protein [Clostridia bacterium]